MVVASLVLLTVAYHYYNKYREELEVEQKKSEKIEKQNEERIKISDARANQIVKEYNDMMKDRKRAKNIVAQSREVKQDKPTPQSLPIIPDQAVTLDDVLSEQESIDVNKLSDKEFENFIIKNQALSAARKAEREINLNNEDLYNAYREKKIAEKNSSTPQSLSIIPDRAVTLGDVLNEQQYKDVKNLSDDEFNNLTRMARAVKNANEANRKIQNN